MPLRRVALPPAPTEGAYGPDPGSLSPEISDSGQASPGWRFTPHVIIFFSSACIMVVELVAGRLTARHLGTSLYTWTSIIGVVLAGMSVGNYLGGRLADRWQPERALGWLFLLSSIACLAALFVNRLVAESVFDPKTVSYARRVVLSTLIVFLPPALALGTVSPMAAKMAILRGKGIGASIGSVYAWGAVGSIVGTFATGFWLIAALGARGVVIAVAGGLAMIGLALGPWRIVHALWVAALVALFWLSQTASDRFFQFACQAGLQDGRLVALPADDNPPWAPGPKAEPKSKFERFLFARDSNYQFVQVYAAGEEWRVPHGRILALDVLLHSFVDLDDPSHAEFEYEQVYAALTEEFMGDRASLRAFFLGGGGYAFPRWIQAQFPGSQCEVAEIDPAVLEASYQALGLPRDTTIHTTVNDARVVVNQLPPGDRYDMIVGDAFSDLAVPFHLTTVEFQRKLKEHLAPGGLVLINVIEDYKAGGRFLGAYIETTKQVFRHVLVFCTYRDGVSDVQDNFIIAATDREDPELFARLQTFRPGHTAYFPGSLLTDENLRALADRCGHRVLTDDNAPVENLLAPIVRY